MNSLRFCISIIIIFSLGIGQLKNLQVLDFESERELKKYMKTISKDLDPQERENIIEIISKLNWKMTCHLNEL